MARCVRSKLVERRAVRAGGRVAGRRAFPLLLLGNPRTAGEEVEEEVGVDGSPIGVEAVSYQRQWSHSTAVRLMQGGESTWADGADAPVSSMEALLAKPRADQNAPMSGMVPRAVRAVAAGVDGKQGLLKDNALVAQVGRCFHRLLETSCSLQGISGTCKNFNFRSEILEFEV